MRPPKKPEDFSRVADGAAVLLLGTETFESVEATVLVDSERTSLGSNFLT